MEWRDEGLVLGVRRHGEHSVIVEAMTREHGRHLGLVRGGRSAAPCRGCPARQYARPRLAGAARRASGRLRRRAARFAGRTVDGERARACRRQLSRRARPASCPSAIRTSACIETLTLIADRLDDTALAPVARRAVRGADPRRMRLPSRSRALRGDGRARGPRLCLAEIGQGGEPRGGRAVARPAPAAAAGSCGTTRTSRRIRAPTTSRTASA